MWPVAPGLLVAAGAANVLFDLGTSTGVSLLTMAVPVVLAIVVTGVVVGGRRGVVVAALLVGLAAYWSWWFGWGLDANISPFSPYLAATGVGAGAAYVVELFIMLWPIVLVVAVGVGVVARRRGRRVWTSLGPLGLAFVVLSLPSVATWDDTCNDFTGPAPLIARPFAQGLMDRGIGVIPSGSETQVFCLGTGQRDWKPFWLGGDGLPPGPTLGTAFSGSALAPRRPDLFRRRSADALRRAAAGDVVRVSASGARSRRAKTARSTHRRMPQPEPSPTAGRSAGAPSR